MTPKLFLLLPPIAFLVALAAMSAQMWGFKIFSRNVPIASKSGGRLKAYACGEDVQDHHVQPEYKQFFQFAFFFTIMHVVGMIVAMVPAGVTAAIWLAVAYLVCAAVGLYILFKR